MATYTEAAKAAMDSGLSELTYVDTVELYNPTAGSVYLVNEPEAVTATLEDATVKTFQPVNMTVELAKSDTPEMTLNVESIQEVITWLRAHQLSRKVGIMKYRTYLSTDLTHPATVNPIEMDIGDISIVTLVAQIKGQFVNLKNRKGPSLRFNNVLSPSLTD